jgi:predicted TIM-barrel fold metal-dependent hydrolase
MWFLRENMRSVDELDVAESERAGIYLGNALKLLGRAH